MKKKLILIPLIPAFSRWRRSKVTGVDSYTPWDKGLPSLSHQYCLTP